MIWNTSCVARSRIAKKSPCLDDLANPVVVFMISSRGPSNIFRSALQLKADGDRRVLKQQNRFHGIALGHGMQGIFSAADDAGHAQHASLIGAGELVLEVSRNHVANLTERVSYLFGGVGCISQHFFGNLPPGLCVTTERQNPAQRPGQTYHRGKLPLWRVL